MNEENTETKTKHRGHAGSGATACSLRDVVSSVLGGVAAISEDLYTDAMEEIATKAGRENDSDLWQDVGAILESLPCPID